MAALPLHSSVVHQAAFVREALRSRGVTSWEAFVAVDADGNAQLAPSELYGFLRWLGVPDLTPDDVVDFFELADKSRDGMIDYHEYMYGLAHKM